MLKSKSFLRFRFLFVEVSFEFNSLPRKSGKSTRLLQNPFKHRIISGFQRKKETNPPLNFDGNFSSSLVHNWVWNWGLGVGGGKEEKRNEIESNEMEWI